MEQIPHFLQRVGIGVTVVRSPALVQLWKEPEPEPELLLCKFQICSLLCFHVLSFTFHFIFTGSK